MTLIRADLAGLPAYVPGRAIRGLIKLASNEVPLPPSGPVLAAIAEAAALGNRYPDLAATVLTARLATALGVDAGRIAVGCGSVSICQQLVQITCFDPSDEVIFAWRSFEAYPIFSGLSGATSVHVPLTADGRHDLEAMAAAVTDRTRLVLVCSPNNPTGPVVHADELNRFLDAVPSDVLVVLDEAYREFVRDPQAPDGLALHLTRPNLAVLRTFSKAYGLAGLRVGFGIAQPPVATALRKAALPFGVSGIAQAAAVASLAAESELLSRVDALVEERTRVATALLEQGWKIPVTEANFVWLPLGADAGQFAATAAGAGLSVRAFEGDGARCTVAEPEANDRLIELCGQWISA